MPWRTGTGRFPSLGSLPVEVPPPAGARCLFMFKATSRRRSRSRLAGRARGLTLHLSSSRADRRHTRFHFIPERRRRKLLAGCNPAYLLPWSAYSRGQAAKNTGGEGSRVLGVARRKRCSRGRRRGRAAFGCGWPCGFAAVRPLGWRRRTPWCFQWASCSSHRRAQEARVGGAARAVHIPGERQGILLRPSARCARAEPTP